MIKFLFTIYHKFISLVLITIIVVSVRFHHGIETLAQGVPGGVGDVFYDSLKKLSANPASSISQAFPSTLATSNVVVVVVIIFRDRMTDCGVVVAFWREGGSLNKVTANL